MQRFWFKTRKHGWGWTPATWEGWITTVVYGVLIIYFTVIYFIRLQEPNFNQIVSTVMYLFLIAAATSILVAICYNTGEKPTWNQDKPKAVHAARTSKPANKKKKRRN